MSNPLRTGQEIIDALNSTPVERIAIHLSENVATERKRILELIGALFDKEYGSLTNEERKQIAATLRTSQKEGRGSREPRALEIQVTIKTATVKGTSAPINKAGRDRIEEITEEIKKAKPHGGTLRSPRANKIFRVLAVQENTPLTGPELREKAGYSRDASGLDEILREIRQYLAGTPYELKTHYKSKNSPEVRYELVTVGSE
jgi:hypothetical protein